MININQYKSIQYHIVAAKNITKTKNTKYKKSKNQPKHAFFLYLLRILKHCIKHKTPN